jgi:two-component system, OmpR family, KDP operon response regulator KdpE
MANPPAEAAPGALAPLVLVVEDEAAVRRFLRATLPGQGYRMVEAETGAQALVEASTRGPDLILLDLGLPDIDGVEVTRRLREWTATPVIVLSARGQERDKIEALDAGADDYLTKPFGVGELMARMRVALRRRDLEGAEESVFQTRDLKVDLSARRVFVRGAEVHLTRTEYRLLTLLVKHAGKVVTHRQLLKEVWGPGSTDQTHYLRVYMGQLRHKIEEVPAQPRYITTEIGVGYRLRVD